MLKVPNKTIALNMFQTEEQIFNLVVGSDHAFRKLKNLINFDELVFPLRKLYSEMGTAGVSIEKGFKALLVQFWEDYSDRELENAVRENMAVRWFCGFSLTEQTPDFSYFSKLRTRIGAKELANIFNKVNETLRNKGLFGDTFTFIDASTIITKTKLWEERDKAIAAGYEKLNNAVVNQYTADKQAKWGAKSKSQIWFGYKRHNAVDMRFGLISKVAVTPANVPDYKTTKNIAPKTGMVFSDKLYDCKENNLALQAKGLHIGTIKKNNNKTKNKDLDRWLSKTRMPFESNFSKLDKRARYRGTVKVYFQCLAQSICYNLKKAIRFTPNLSAA
jgi:IS5 family transposase